VEDSVQKVLIGVLTILLTNIAGFWDFFAYTIYFLLVCKLFFFVVSLFFDTSTKAGLPQMA
jgi:hypothetical protein